MTNAAETLPIALDPAEKRVLMVAQDMRDLKNLVHETIEKAKREKRIIAVGLWDSIIVIVCPDDNDAEGLLDEIIQELASSTPT